MFGFRTLVAAVALVLLAANAAKQHLQITLDARDLLEWRHDRISVNRLPVNEVKINLLPNDPLQLEPRDNRFLDQLKMHFPSQLEDGNEIKKIVSLASWENRVAYLMEVSREVPLGPEKSNSDPKENKDDSLIVLLLEMTKHLEDGEWVMRSKIKYIPVASNDTACTDMEMDAEKLYIVCLEEYTHKMVLGVVSHRREETLVFRVVPGNYEFPSQSIRHVKAKLHLMQDIKGTSTVVIFVSQSPSEFFHRHFVLFEEQQFFLKQIPVVSFIIARVQIVNINRDKELLNLLVCNLRGGGMEVFEVTIKFGYIDKQELKRGLLASKVSYMKSFGKRVILASLASEINQVSVKILEIESQLTWKINIPNQIRVNRIIGRSDYMVVETITSNYKKGLYVVDLVNWRQCEVTIHQDLIQGVISFTQIGQESFLAAFDPVNFVLNVFRLVPFQSVWISFTDAARKEITRLEKINEKQRYKFENWSENPEGDEEQAMGLIGPSMGPIGPSMGPIGPSKLRLSRGLEEAEAENSFPAEMPPSPLHEASSETTRKKTAQARPIAAPLFIDFSPNGFLMPEENGVRINQMTIVPYVHGEKHFTFTQELIMGNRADNLLRMNVRGFVASDSSKVLMLNPYLQRVEVPSEEESECNPQVIFGTLDFYGYMCIKANTLWVLEGFDDPGAKEAWETLNPGRHIDKQPSDQQRRLKEATKHPFPELSDEELTKRIPVTKETVSSSAGHDPFNPKPTFGFSTSNFDMMKPTDLKMRRREIPYAPTAHKDPSKQKVADIVDYIVFRERYLLLLTKACRIDYLNLQDTLGSILVSPMAVFGTNDDLEEEGVRRCRFTFQSVVVETATATKIHYISMKNGTLFVTPGKEFPSGTFAHDNLSNDMIEADKFVSLRYNQESQTHSLVWETQKGVSGRINDFPEGLVGPDTRMTYVFPDMLVLWTPNKPQKNLVGVSEGSFLFWAHPNLLADGVRSIRGVFPFKTIPLFVLAYETTTSLIQGLILGFSANAPDRVLGHLILETGDCGEILVDISPIGNNAYRISSMCRGQSNYVRRWDFRPDGPFLHPFTVLSHNQVDLDNNKVILSFASLPKIPEGRLEVSELRLIQEPKLGMRTRVDLESEEAFVVEGYIDSVILAEKMPGVEFVPRVSLQTNVLMLQDSACLTKQLNVIPGIFKSKPIFSFDNFFFYENKLELTNHVKECREVRIMKDYSRLDNPMSYLLLCRSSDDESFFVIDSESMQLQLSNSDLDPNLQIGDIFATIQESSVNLFVQIAGTTLLRYIWLNVEKTSWIGRVLFTETLNLDPFNLGKTSIESLMLFPEENWVTIFYHLRYSSRIHIKRFSLEDITFDPASEETIRFYDVREVPFFVCKFFRQKDELRALLTTEQMIYEIKFVQFQEWDYAIMAKYLVGEGLSQTQVTLSVSKNYLAVLVNEDESEKNLYLYKKDDKKSELNVPFCHVGRQTLRLTEDSVDHYWVGAFQLVEDKISFETTLHIAVMRDLIENSKVFTSMHQMSLSVQPFGLVLDFNELDYVQTLRFDYKTDNGREHHEKMQLKIQANFKYTILIWVLVTFLGLFVILVFGVIYTHRQNVKLQRHIEAQLLTLQEKKDVLKQQQLQRERADRVQRELDRSRLERSRMDRSGMDRSGMDRSGMDRSFSHLST